MKNTYKYIITAILVCAIAIPALAFGQTVGGGNTNGSDVNPSSDGGLTVGGGNTNGSNPGSNGLSTGGGNTNGSDVNPSSNPGLTVGGGSTNGSNTGTTDTTVPPVTPGGGTNNPGSGTSGGTGGGLFSITNATGTSSLPILINIGQCSYLNSYMKLGGNNSQSEVLKLQAFLSSVENIPVLTTGIFDTQTFEAVKTFQAKYVTEILAPWGVTTPTGQVWYTTKKKVNEVFCKANFALTPDQIREIEAYRLGISVGAVDALGNPIDPNATGTIPLLPEVGNASGTNSQTAALGDLSIFQRFVNFLKWLFHR